MYFAVHNQKPRLLKLLLEHGGNPSLSGWGGGEDESLLSVAALHGDEEIVTILVSAGADVNWVDKKWGSTAAISAAATGRFDLVAYFLNHGLTADLDGLARSCQGRQVPPESEMQVWKDKVLAMLKERGAKFTLDKN
jgi:ankyrin repeat protein